VITGEELKKGFSIALKLIEAEKEHINAINVYPVADGDTGTNLLLTIKGAIENVDGFSQVNVIAKELAEGMLESARGNSGVILSQFMWGFMEAIEGKDVLTNEDFARAIVNGTKLAYTAVDNPVEGTILSVMRAAARAAVENISLPKEQFLKVIFETAVDELNRTPDMLAKLGKPRVIDSGAYGFVLLLEGLVRAVGGSARVRRVKAEKSYREKDGEKFFCSNFLLRLNRKVAGEKLREKLRELGNSIVIVNSGEMVKVHIHTSSPGHVEEVLKRFGEIKNFRVEKI